MDIPEYTFKEVGYSGPLQDIANILEYPQEQVLFSGLMYKINSNCLLWKLLHKITSNCFFSEIDVQN